MDIKGINHIGVAVSNMEGVRKIFSELLGLKEAHSEIIDGAVEAKFFSAGNASIELFRAIGTDSIAAEYLKSVGPGINHIALEVDDIDEAAKKLTKIGAPLVNSEPKEGARDTRILLLNYQEEHGFLLELVGPK